MEGKLTQKSTLEQEMVRILNEEFDKDMETDSALEKKKEILDLFTNYNKLVSEQEFDQVISKLHMACRDCDLELIKICLSETIEDESKNLTFKIDKTNKTASLFNVNDKIEDLFIPRTINHESTDYLITSITGICRNIKSLKFSEDSAVKTIYGNVFSFSHIEELYFPESLNELKEGWCSYANYLKRIIVSPLNCQFKFIEDKYLVGKSEPNKEEFDVLLFARRDINEISIPSNIKIISSSAFFLCRNLNKVEIPTNSNLQLIGSSAFESSQIEEISIPPTVSKICENAFNFCSELRKVEIPTNSNLQLIGSGAFESSQIEEISIPPTVSKICEKAFNFCSELRKVEIPTNSKLQSIGSSAFGLSKIEELYFPESLNELKDGWCSYADCLKRIIVSPLNCQFKFIEDKYLFGKSEPNKEEFDVLLFARRDISEISIPTNIKIISSSAFYGCKNLNKVKNPTNSILQSIGSNAFHNTIIEEIFIPPTVITICKYAFYGCKNLKKVEIPTNSNLQIIESSAFKGSIIEEIFIPPTVLKICENAFSDCKNLKKVEIPTNSNLQIIESNAFYNTIIEEISIPSNVLKICEETFCNCQELRKVEIPKNSTLQSIGSSAFSGSKIEELYFPESLNELKDGWCHITDYLKRIIVSPLNCQFKFIEDQYLFGKSESNKEEYDVLLFARRDINKISIPSNIKIISSSAFYGCKSISKVEIPTNSNLQSIGSNAFGQCIKLRKFKIPTNSNLQSIGSYAFFFSNIESIFIPPTISSIHRSTFDFCQRLRKIEIPANSNLQIIEERAFDCSNIEEILIPPKVKKICEYAFFLCPKLRKVEIPTNSDLQKIEICAFSYSNIESIIIPSNVRNLASAINNCEHLQIIEISEESKLNSVPIKFLGKSLKSIIMIPPSLIKLIDTE